MIIYFRCVRNKKKCRFFLFKNYAKCIRVDKKYELVILKINFFNIDKIMTKLEKKIENQDCLRNCERIDSFETIEIETFSKTKTFFKKT